MIARETAAQPENVAVPLDARGKSQTIAQMPDTAPALRTDTEDHVGLAPMGPAYTLHAPDQAAAPVVFASPHSGNLYPEAMQAALCVPLIDLRRTEDAFIDELFLDAPAQGAFLLAARYGRSVADLNRDPHELDPTMFADGPPRTCGLPTARVEAGLGCLPRVGARGEAIYHRPLTRLEGEQRLACVHDAYHARLSELLETARATHGRALLIDCHSMPSIQPGRRGLTDIVLGDRFGSSCDARLTARVERAFRNQGLSVARNAPYAGGYTTRRYGRPRRNVHALQIEINRALYMDEHLVTRSESFSKMKAIVGLVVAEILNAASQLPAR